MCFLLNFIWFGFWSNYQISKTEVSLLHHDNSTVCEARWRSLYRKQKFRASVCFPWKLHIHSFWHRNEYYICRRGVPAAEYGLDFCSCPLATWYKAPSFCPSLPRPSYKAFDKWLRVFFWKEPWHSVENFESLILGPVFVQLTHLIL